MAKQVQVLVICDWCKKRWQDGDEEAPVEREWTWNGANYVVEVCHPCLDAVKEMLNPLFEASELKKRKGPGRPRMTHEERLERQRIRRKLPRGSFDKYKDENGLYHCPGEGCDRAFEYAQHLGNHHNKIHGFLLD